MKGPKLDARAALDDEFSVQCHAPQSIFSAQMTGSSGRGFSKTLPGRACGANDE